MFDGYLGTWAMPTFSDEVPIELKLPNHVRQLQSLARFALDLHANDFPIRGRHKLTSTDQQVFKKIINDQNTCYLKKFTRNQNAASIGVHVNADEEKVTLTLHAIGDIKSYLLEESFDAIESAGAKCTPRDADLWRRFVWLTLENTETPSFRCFTPMHAASHATYYDDSDVLDAWLSGYEDQEIPEGEIIDRFHEEEGLLPSELEDILTPTWSGFAKAESDELIRLERHAKRIMKSTSNKRLHRLLKAAVDLLHESRRSDAAFLPSSHEEWMAVLADEYVEPLGTLASVASNKESLSYHLDTLSKYETNVQQDSCDQTFFAWTFIANNRDTYMRSFEQLKVYLQRYAALCNVLLNLKEADD